MAIVAQCDRCGEYGRHYQKLEGDALRGLDQYGVDLCPGCVASLRKWRRYHSEQSAISRVNATYRFPAEEDRVVILCQKATAAQKSVAKALAILSGMERLLGAIDEPATK